MTLAMEIIGLDGSLLRLSVRENMDLFAAKKYVRLVVIENDEIRVATEEDIPADIEAEQAAAEAARKATPIIYDQPIEAPMVSLLSQSSGKGVAIVATDDGVLTTAIVHESPWPDAATLKAKVDAAIAKRNDLQTKGKAGISGQLQARIENIERFLGWRT